MAQYAWTPDGYVVADLIDVTLAVAAGKFGKPYPRPADRIKTAQLQRDRFVALEEQADRNRRRDAGQ